MIGPAHWWWLVPLVLLVAVLGTSFVYRRRFTRYMRRRAEQRRQRKLDELRDNMYPLW